MNRTVLCLVACAIPLVAWASDGGAKGGIDAGNRKFEAAVAKGDPAAITKLYAVDAQILPPDAPPAKGREAIEKEFAGMLGAGFKKIVLTTEEVFPQGNFATEVGHWRLEDAAGKGVEGKYVVVWKKNGKTWEYYRDMWSGDAPPPPPAPAAPAPAAAPPAK